MCEIDEKFDESLWGRGYLHAEAIFSDLQNGKLTSVQDSLARLDSVQQGQVQFWTRLELINLILGEETDAINNHLMTDVVEAFAKRILKDKTGPRDKHYWPGWHVKPNLRWCFWAGGKIPAVFSAVLKEDHDNVILKDLDPDSLYWILHEAIFCGNLDIVKHFWSWPQRLAINVDLLYFLFHLPHFQDKDVSDIRRYMLTDLDQPTLMALKEKEAQTQERIQIDRKPVDWDMYT